MQQGTGGFLNPEKILEQIDVREGMRVADFGCGHGYFSIPLANLVGRGGKVYSLDIIKDALEAINSQAQLKGIVNIETIRCNLENPNGSKLPDNSLDLAILANVLFFSQKKSEIIREAKRTLKKGHQLVLIDWIAGASLSPNAGWLISKEEAKGLAEAEGLILEKEIKADSQHYGIVFKK